MTHGTIYSCIYLCSLDRTVVSSRHSYCICVLVCWYVGVLVCWCVCWGAPPKEEEYAVFPTRRTPRLTFKLMSIPCFLESSWDYLSLLILHNNNKTPLVLLVLGHGEEGGHTIFFLVAPGTRSSTTV
jgi:hypothetical protein